MIALACGDAVAEIVPERGAIVTRLRLADEEVLFLDPSTLADPAKNVRGGIPILFPIAGKPVPPLAQHGFARNLSWEVVASEAARAELRLTSSPETLALFPHPFALTLVATLTERSLRLEFSVHNPGAQPLPLHFGLHPYFRVVDKRAAWIETDATVAHDNRSGAEAALQRLDFDVDELDLALLDHDESATVLHRGEGPALRLRWSEELRTLVLWTLRGREFICVEPWTAPGLALKSGEGLLQIGPGGTLTLWLEISVS